MHLSSALLAATVTLVAGAAAVEIRDFAPLEARQSPAQLECHSDCGNTILDAALPDHCTNTTWTGLLQDCLACAQTFNIWRIYGESVTAAATACGLSAEPSASGAGSGGAPSTSGAPAAPTASGSTTPAPTGAPTAAAPSSTSTTAGAPPGAGLPIGAAVLVAAAAAAAAAVL